MSFPRPFRVKVGRFLWPTPPPGARDGWPWPNGVYEAVFNRFVRDYWLRNTFGIVDVQFDLSATMFNRLGDLDPAALAPNRGAAIPAIREYAQRELEWRLSDYDGFIAFVHAPPCDAGALGTGNLLLDQGGSLEFFEHEVGHMIGLDHAFPLYDDRYCLMGETWSWDHPVTPPPEATGIPFLSGDMWRSGRRVSAASLFRRFGRYGLPEAPLFDAPYVVDVGHGAHALLSSLSEATTPRAVVAIVPIVFGLGGVLAVEYRTATGDDAGLGADAVVVHSIGYRPAGPGLHEARLVWLEASLPVELGATASVPGARIRVGRLNPPALYGAPLADGSRRVYITVERDV